MTSLAKLYQSSNLRRRLGVIKRTVKAAQITMRHNALLHKKADQTNLKVAFVVLTESSWKLEPLLCRMENDDVFETAVIVTPLLTLDEDLRRIEQESTKTYFETREGGSTALTTPEELTAFDPDIIFLTNPHQLSLPDFYDKLFKNKLCCYAPYTHGVDQYDGNQAQYNQPFHNAMWRIFAPHDVAKKVYQSIAIRKGKNVLVTGYPACEPLLDCTPAGTAAWKTQSQNKLKIIWAPHHTIDAPELPYANFLRYADDFVALAKHHQEDIQWAFKPHPLLKSKLYKHPDWGKLRTEAFFKYWKSADYCQLEEGGYVDLFRQSDAMIHDSASFMAEYLYLDKPILFMQGVDNIRDYFNDFGVAAFEASEHARNFKEIEGFIGGLSQEKAIKSSKRAVFFDENIEPYFTTYPSEKIVNHIKSMFPKLCNVDNSGQCKSLE